ncbi:acyl-CoA synthetase (AMP-forming)/AMP-acid ligase II [Nocardioides daedukensis]|uniref:Acyl-CoA synthetase (AMP-forming)/AMP-acid ligase II n=1 Tax=Nocardioides daedukensis TaxID=634462 RepID=A0A7Y9S008_9ACTN|nr:long-chain-fatty-acid--CoA ligase [Nocardioides daedukensis]NYG59766.1 acyl-CoA synthetase (AMP-forming)/AMP-acid ligase II [Nocardioides daedukensis]
MQITQSLHQAVQSRPDQVATIFGSRTRTVAETADRVARMAGALRELGVVDGERVGIYALNSDRYHELLYAVPWAGGVVNPVNSRWSVTEVAYSLVDCGTDIVLVDDAFAGTVDELRAKAPNLREVIYCGEGETPDGLLSYEDLVAGAELLEDARRRDEDLYGVYYTGGTTGAPKGVMLDHRALLTSAMGCMVTTDMLSRGGVLLHAAPMFHLADGAAWNIANLTHAVHVIVPSFTVAGVVDAIEKHGVTDALLVPTMIQAIVDSPEAATADLTSMQRVMYGASPISESVLNRARATFANARFTQAYGMTELAPVATLLTADDHDVSSLARSAGRAAAHAEVRVVGPDDQTLPRGEVGEIVSRGDHVMQGYWNKPDETAQALAGGWMHTGDAGYMDADGYLFVVDRIKDMVISGGENVYSVEVENALVKHDRIMQAAVVGVPDDTWGERVHAFLILREGEDITLEEVREWCRQHIANYKLPRSIDVVDSFPVSGAGKVLKRELRKEFWGNSDRSIN